MDLALNNLQRLICHKTQQTKPNQPDILFDVQTLYSSRRDIKMVRVYEQRHKETTPTRTEISESQLLNDSQIFQNSLNSLYLNSGYRLCNVISISYCVISLMSPIPPCFHFFNQICDKTWIHYVHIWSSFVGCWCTRLNFPVWLTFLLTDFS